MSPVSATDTSRIRFSISAAKESKVADRFTIVSKSLSLLPVTFTGIQAVAKAKSVDVQWNTANETNIRSYEVEKGTSGSDFSKIGEVTATNSKSYHFTDTKPFNGINYYRVKSISLSGEAYYTSIANVSFGTEGKASMVAYPNPLTSNHFKLELTNKTAGNYVMSVINTAGQTVYTTSLTVAEGQQYANGKIAFGAAKRHLPVASRWCRQNRIVKTDQCILNKNAG